MSFLRFTPAFAAVLALTSSVALAAGTAPKLSTKHPSGDYIATAATSNGATHCSALQSQFDSAIKSHETAKKAATAKSLRQEGGQLCASGKTADGIKKLEQALDDISVKPMKATN